MLTVVVYHQWDQYLSPLTALCNGYSVLGSVPIITQHCVMVIMYWDQYLSPLTALCNGYSVLGSVPITTHSIV